MYRPPARQMSDNELDAELRELFAKWDDLRKDLEESGGMSGSPGEWLVERMDEIEAEKSRRLDKRLSNPGGK